MGSRVVYASSSLALATLEAQVHLPSYKQLKKYKCLSISFDETWIFTPAALPDGWDLVPPTTISQSFGDQWLSLGELAVLSIYSFSMLLESWRLWGRCCENDSIHQSKTDRLIIPNVCIVLALSDSEIRI